MSALCLSLKRCAPLLAALLLALTVGCPSTPMSSKPGDGGGGLSENAADVKALEAANATLVKNPAGRVVEVNLSPDQGGDADLAHLKGLPNVRILGATEVRGVTDAGLALLAGHPNLRTIKLERTSVTDAGMPHLQKIPHLEELDVRRLGITLPGYQEIGKLTGLKRLRVVYNSLNFKDDCLLAIKDLKNLEVLDMQDCNLPTEKGLVVVQGFPKLRNLRMYGPNINDKVLSYVTGAKELRALYLEQSGVTKAGLDQLRELPNLVELGLYGALGVNDAAVESVGVHKKLTRLELRSTPVTSLALSYLKEMKNLKVLDLAETANVGNEGLEYIKGLTNLEELNLWSCQIDDGGLPHLAGMKKLKWLKLDKCEITDEGLKHLAGLTSLEYLHIGSTKVTDEGLPQLKGLKNLKTLVVTFLDGVTDEGVAKLKKDLPGLTEVER